MDKSERLNLDYWPNCPCRVPAVCLKHDQCMIKFYGLLIQRSTNCPQHSEDQRMEVRSMLLRDRQSSDVVTPPPPKRSKDRYVYTKSHALLPASHKSCIKRDTSLSLSLSLSLSFVKSNSFYPILAPLSSASFPS